jgi:hypothetical protein
MEYRVQITKLAFYTICLGSDPQNVFLEAEEIVSQKPIALMNISYRNIKKQNHLEMVDTFVKNIKQNLKEKRSI